MRRAQKAFATGKWSGAGKFASQWHMEKCLENGTAVVA